jgi:hypothetical protein
MFASKQGDERLKKLEKVGEELSSFIQFNWKIWGFTSKELFF